MPKFLGLENFTPSLEKDKERDIKGIISTMISRHENPDKKREKTFKRFDERNLKVLESYPDSDLKTAFLTCREMQMLAREDPSELKKYIERSADIASA